jgi:hypothetical protein
VEETESGERKAWSVEREKVMRDEGGSATRGEEGKAKGEPDGRSTTGAHRAPLQKTLAPRFNIAPTQAVVVVGVRLRRSATARHAGDSGMGGEEIAGGQKHFIRAKNSLRHCWLILKLGLCCQWRGVCRSKT